MLARPPRSNLWAADHSCRSAIMYRVTHECDKQGSRKKQRKSHTERQRVRETEAYSDQTLSPFLRDRFGGRQQEVNQRLQQRQSAEPRKLCIWVFCLNARIVIVHRHATHTHIHSSALAVVAAHTPVPRSACVAVASSALERRVRRRRTVNQRVIVRVVLGCVTH